LDEDDRNFYLHLAGIQNSLAETELQRIASLEYLAARMERARRPDQNEAD